MASTNLQFIGRKRECELLNRLCDKQSASMVVITGRRRIGKSRLIEEFGKEHPFYSFAGLAPSKEKVTGSISQQEEFARQMARQFNMPVIKNKDWSDMLWFLANQTTQGRVVILLDEISWMASEDPDFLGKLKNAWDMYFKKNPNLILILCGSVSAWVERHIVNSTGFVGRVSLTITLKELPLYRCIEFWGKKGDMISPYEKFKFLSVTGGIPRYLEELRPNLTSEENIKLLCFNKEGILFREFEQIFPDLFLSRSPIYRKIVSSLAEQGKEHKALCQSIGVEPNKTITDYLDELIKAGFVSRDYTWHIKTKKTSKLSKYRLRDNYLRFYFRYILPNKDRIERDAFDDIPVTALPGWDTVMGLQFENLILNNRKTIHKIIGIHPMDIINDNPFFQHKTAKQKGCQIDYLIQTKHDVLYVCEIKFSRKTIGTDIIDEMRKKWENLKKPKYYSARFVLIHINEVSENVVDSDFFSKIIDFSEFFNN